MLNEKELKSELEALAVNIEKKSQELQSAEQKHAEATAAYNADPSKLNEADMVIAHSDVVNCRAELYLLKRRQESYSRQLEFMQEQAGPANG